MDLQVRDIDSRIKNIEKKVERLNKKNGLEGEGLKEACQEFEAMFINNVFKTMRDTVSRSDLIKKGLGEDIFIGLHDQELSKSASRTNQFGLADMLYNQLIQKQFNGATK
ncbi:MAG: rod-binding protein [bacterium]